jgi:phospholipase C
VITRPQNGVVKIIDHELVEFDLNDWLPESFEVKPNEGFIIDFANSLANKYSSLTKSEIQQLRGEVMGYHPANHVPVYDFFADQFCVCDQWYASHPGHTWPNRFVTLTGALAPGKNGLPQIDNPELATYDPLEVATIFDHLSAAGVEWRYFEHDLSMLRLFSKYTFDTECILPVNDPEKGFFAMARRGNLPPVTFIEPSLTDLPPGNDDHPPSDISDGQQLVNAIYKALRESPIWNKTLFIITYDEHGGFYDHVHPKELSIFDHRTPEYDLSKVIAPLGFDPDTGKAINYYGMRVPAFVISPWIPLRMVSHEIYDHTSILKTIITRFLSTNPPNMGRRVALANHVGSLLALDSPRTQLPAFDYSKPSTVAHAAPIPGSVPADDFHHFMSGFLKRLRKC